MQEIFWAVEKTAVRRTAGFAPARHGSSPVTTALTCSDTARSRSCRIPALQIFPVPVFPVPGACFTEQARNIVGP